MNRWSHDCLDSIHTKLVHSYCRIKETTYGERSEPFFWSIKIWYQLISIRKFFMRLPTRIHVNKWCLSSRRSSSTNWRKSMVANVWSTPIGYFITMLSRQPCSAVWQLVSQVIKDASCLLNIENTLTFFSIFFFLSTKHFYRSFYWYSWQLLLFIIS